MKTVCAVATGLLLAGPWGATAAPEKLLVFDFAFDNTSMEPTSAAETARIKRASEALREALENSGEYTVSGGDPAQFSSMPGIGKCSQDELAAAQKQGVRFVACGWVQKVSNLILNMNMVIEDAKTGQQLHGGSVDMRGNTDQSWDRGLKYLLEEHVLPPKS